MFTTVKKSLLIKIIFVSLLAALFISPFWLHADTRTDRVDKLFAQWNKKDSPGCALGIIRDGDFIYRRGYGMANLEYSIPLSARSVFRIGSTSKQFTAMCIALLEEEGKLSFDDSIRKYIPEMPDYGVPVLIRHLLHHTSGIRDYLSLWDLSGAREADFFVDGEVVALLTRQKALNFKPGEEWLYSNSGYFLLAEIVKRITGRSMRIYAEEKIFKPLGMKNTHFHNDHTEIVKDRASGYMPKKRGKFKIAMTNLDMIGDGGVFTCVDDLLLWDRNFYENRLGKRDPALIERILTTGRLNSGKVLDYALGLNSEKYRGLKMISHGGAFVGFRAEMIRFPEQRFSVIVLANLGSINPSRLARDVADIYLEDVMTKAGMPKKAAEKPKFIPLSQKKLGRLAGTYVDRMQEHAVRIIQTKKGLTAFRGSNPLRFLPVAEQRFVSSEPPHLFSLEFSGEKTSVRLVIHGPSSKPELFFRVPSYDPAEEELKSFTGRYYSLELNISYDLHIESDGLHAAHQNPFKNSPKAALVPIRKDWFSLSGWSIKFLRNEKGAVEAFVINAGRVKNIRFERADSFKKILHGKENCV